MKHKKQTVVIAITFAVLAISLQLTAQDWQANKHHHYKLIDLGTFGGTQSYVSPGSGSDFGQHIAAVNGKGAVVGFADTSASDPFPKFCFWDCSVVHAFLSDSSGILTDLGALPSGGSSVPNWITANGLIAGLSENGETDPKYSGLPQLRAVLWKNGEIIDLKTLPEGGYQSEANSVNSSGQVVGAALNTTPDDNSMEISTFWLWGGISPPYRYQTRAFIWDQENGMQDLRTLGGTDAQALLINDRGQVVGHSYINSTPSPLCTYPLATRSFIWEKQTGMVDLGSFGGTCTVATDLNERGQVVGSSNFKGDQSYAAFLWERGQLHRLGGSLGGNCAGAVAINEAGESVGFGYLEGGDCITGNVPFHATLWKHIDEITDLGVIGNDQCSYAADINAQGQVVGSSGSDCSSDSNVFKAFLWDKGTLFDLNSLVPPNSPLFLETVFTINDRGEIAGQGVDNSAGDQHAFLLIPCDGNHPNIEDCDYSVVDASTAPQVNSPSVPQGATSPRRARPEFPGEFNPLLRFGQRLGLRNRAVGAQTPTPTLNSRPPASMAEEKCPSGLPDDGKADHLLDPPLWSLGHCGEADGKLTGYCMASIFVAPGCVSVKSEHTCPRGAKAKKPGLTECCGRMACVKVTVDLERGCL